MPYGDPPPWPWNDAIGYLPWWMVGGCGCDPRALRPLSDEELMQRAQSQALQMANAKPSAEWLRLLAPYRPPVTVPEGWSEWFANGDALR